MLVQGAWELGEGIFKKEVVAKTLYLTSNTPTLATHY